MNRLEFERRKKHWSQWVLALKVGVTQPVIACAEAGTVSDDTLERISDVLSISPPQVLLREVRPILEPEELGMQP